MSIFRHGPPTVRKVRPPKAEQTNPAGKPPDLPALPAVHYAEIKTVRSKPYLAIPIGEEEKTRRAQQGPRRRRADYVPAYVLTGKDFKEFVAAIDDNEKIMFIDVSEGAHPRLTEVLAGVAIVGKK